MLLALILVSVYGYVLTGYSVVKRWADPWQEHIWFCWANWLAVALWPPLLTLELCERAYKKVQTAWTRFRIKKITTKLGEIDKG